MLTHQQNRKFLSKDKARPGGKSVFLLRFLLLCCLFSVLAGSLWAFKEGTEPFQPGLFPGAALAGLVLLGFTIRRGFEFFRSSHSKEPGRDEADRDQLNKIIQSTPQPILIVDSSGKALTFNKRFADLFALVPGQDFFLLSDQPTASWDLKDAFSRAVLGESIVLPEMWRKLYFQKSPPGYREICLSWAFIPVRNASGLVEKVYVKIEDCTERKRQEEEIAQEKSRLQAALKGARQVTCEIDPLTGKIVIGSPNSGSETFYRPDGLNGLENFEELIHPDDQHQFLNLVKEHALQQDAHLNTQFRVQLEPGEWSWLQFRGQAFASSDNSQTMLLGVMMDVTREKEYELTLKESETRYRTLFANALEGMYLIHTNDSVICVNQAFATLLGYDSPAHFETGSLGTHFSQIYYIPKIREIKRQTLLDKGQIQQMETQVRRRDGSLIWISENARAIKDDAGNILYFEGSLTDITARKESEECLLHQALYDHRTNLPNRSFFAEKVDQALKKVRSDLDYAFALLYFDLDGFSAINDSFGHFVGDRLLLEVSQRTQEALGPADTLARFSSDEFGIMVEGRSRTGIQDLAEKLRQELEKVFALDGMDIFITASIGILDYDPTYTRPEDMLRDVELAMHQAKKRGKNQWVIFSSEMYKRKSERTLMEKDLRRAMDREELVLNYQPIVRLDCGELNGLEALIRWNHPEHGCVSPDKFIPLAEDTGLIEPIGDWVLRESCRQIKIWREHNNSLIMNVNISAKQLEKAGLERKVYQVLQDTNLEARCLNLEITESMAMLKMEANVRTLNRLKYMGVRLSIDDFGTGYSSLAHLQRFPLDELKIDRSFISSLNAGRSNIRIVQAIVELALGLKLQMVAEGIETKAQLNKVKTFNCHYGQGFLFSKALKPADIETIWFAPGQNTASQNIFQNLFPEVAKPPLTNSD
ncbi:MAG: EAL domain-containing protein [Desulfovermiculus sp.]